MLFRALRSLEQKKPKPASLCCPFYILSQEVAQTAALRASRSLMEVPPVQECGRVCWRCGLCLIPTASSSTPGGISAPHMYDFHPGEAAWPEHPECRALLKDWPAQPQERWSCRRWEQGQWIPSSWCCCQGSEPSSCSAESQVFNEKS